MPAEHRAYLRINYGGTDACLTYFPHEAIACRELLHRDLEGTSRGMRSTLCNGPSPALTDTP